MQNGRKVCSIVCVQNMHSLATSADQAPLMQLAREGTAYVPFFTLGGSTPLQSDALSEVATALGATPMQMALAWLLQRAPNVLLIPGTSSVAHLQQNLAAANLQLPPDAVARLDGLGAVAPAGTH